MNPLGTPKAQALQKTMAEASEALREARARFERAMDTASDIGGNADGLLTLRREGQGYAQALTRSTTATMHWLQYVDTMLRSERYSSKNDSGE